MRKKRFYVLAFFGLLVALCAVPVQSQAKTPKPERVAVTSVKSSSSGKVTVKYKKVKKASGYQIAVAVNSKFSKGKKTYTTSKTTKTVTLSKGKKYYVKVRAYRLSGKKKIYGSWSQPKAVTTRPGTPSGVTCYKQRKNSLYLKWKKTSGAKGYQVMISRDKRFKTGNRVIRVSDTQERIGDLKSGKTYYMKVRAYTVTSSGKKVYGAWSKAATGKTIAASKTNTYEEKDNPDFGSEKGDVDVSDEKTSCIVNTEKSKYSYELKVLNNPEYNLYNGEDIIIYIKTNNPDPDTITFPGFGYDYNMSGGSYADIHFIPSDEYNWEVVEGGYLETICFKKSGAYDFEILENINGRVAKAASIRIDVKDFDKAEEAWYQDTLKKVATPDMTAKEKMDALETYFRKNFIHPYGTVERPVLKLVQNQGAWFETKIVSCWTATDAMIRFAQMLGLEAKSEDPGYGAALHQAAHVKIDGVWYWYDADPGGQFFDTLYPDWDYIL